MMGVLASEAHGEWIEEQLHRYDERPFIIEGEEDLTTNVKFVTDFMIQNGFTSDGKEQDYKDLHIFPVDYFCPRQTTGEFYLTNHTYCDHKGQSSSWARKGKRENQVDWYEQVLPQTFHRD